MNLTIDADVRSTLLADENLQRVVDQLYATKKGNAKSASLSSIWSVFCSTYEDIPSGRERRVWLRVVLDELDGSEEITLPVPHGKQWDRTSDVPLPTKVKMRSVQPPPESTNWKSFAWNPKLEWVSDRRYVAPAQVEFLFQVNLGLAEGWFENQETLKYRSLQLTGDEKRLVKFAKTKLFGVDRLSLEMLGCQTEMLPIAFERIGDGTKMLMFENAAPFIAARRIARDLVQSKVPLRFDVVAYGAGKQVVKAARYLPTLNPIIDEVHYVGDLDAEGLQIAYDLKRISSTIPIIPATDFHTAMRDSAERMGYLPGWPTLTKQGTRASNLVSKFLDASIRSHCLKMIEAGKRIPEEALSCGQISVLLRKGEFKKN